MTKNTITELLLTKFCHDIAGAVGAMLNGSELLTDSFDDKEFLTQATNTLIDSSKFLTYRLRFFRAAFGTPKQHYAPETAIQLATDYISTLHDINLNWENEGEEDFALTRIKLISCLICISTLSKGGEIAVNGRTIIVSGPNAMLSDAMETALNGNILSEENSEVAPGLFLCNYMKDTGYKLSVDKDANCVTFKIENLN